MEIPVNVLFGALISAFGGCVTILISLVVFFFRRERELGTMQATMLALHKRIDRFERLSNGKKTVAEQDTVDRAS